MKSGIPFFEALLSLAQKGEKCRCKKFYEEAEAEKILFPGMVTDSTMPGVRGGHRGGDGETFGREINNLPRREGKVLS